MYVNSKRKESVVIAPIALTNVYKVMVSLIAYRRQEKRSTIFIFYNRYYQIIYYLLERTTQMSAYTIETGNMKKYNKFV